MTIRPLSTEFPAHVSPELVSDFDIYNPEGRGDSEGSIEGYFGMFRSLVLDGTPEFIWTRYNGGHWIPARARHAQHILMHPEHFSSARGGVPDEDNIPGQFFRPVQLDPPEAQKYRSLINPAFSPANVEKMEEPIREYAASLIDSIRRRGECDFVADFALMLPINIFLRLVDLPFEHRYQLVELVHKQVTKVEGARVNHLTGILDYLKPIIEERNRNPGPDLISQLTRKTIDGRSLSESELLGMTSLLLLGGLDTVVAQLGFFAHFLAQNPACRAQLIGDPASIPNAVEELIRRYPIATGFGRIVTTDLEYAGVRFRRGDHVMCPTSVFNLDHRTFEDPMNIDFKRQIRFNGAFGSGTHRCVGSFLARTELKVFIEEWLRRIPDFRIKPNAKVKVRAGANATLVQLPLEWSAVAGQVSMRDHGI